MIQAGGYSRKMGRGIYLGVEQSGQTRKNLVGLGTLVLNGLSGVH
jgi:hypothetical protein